MPQEPRTERHGGGSLAEDLDEWLRGLSPATKKELAELVRACGGDESALDRIAEKPRRE